MTSSRLGGTLLTTVALLSVGFATPAGAEIPMSTVTLTIEAPQGGLSRVRLDCDPPGGSHPDSATACAEIAAAGGDLSQLEEQLVSCTMELRPVTASARGVWEGEVVLWQREYSNPCTMRAATGSVFDF